MVAATDASSAGDGGTPTASPPDADQPCDAEGAACASGDACFPQGGCHDGRCVPVELGRYDDGDACTLDICDPATLKVSHPSIPTDDGDPSTVDLCDPATGVVRHAAFPALDPTVATRLAEAARCLYQGLDAPQTGVTAAIDPVSIAVVQGKVLAIDGTPLSGVAVSVLGHGAGDAESFGEARSRADGRFDLALKGGQTLTLKYEKRGYLPVQRQVAAAWQRWSPAPDVAMTELDPEVTAVALGDAGAAHIARGSVQSDIDGVRQATLVFARGTSGTMTAPDASGPSGATKVVTLPSEVHLRATEYTVGENGPKAMPGTLPATIGYTYAVELSLDEAVAAGATRVDFDRPVAFYVENFLGFPVGMAVPVGYYDRVKGAWVPSDDGRVIEIVNVDGGVASVDIDGDGSADEATPPRFGVNPGAQAWSEAVAHLWGRWVPPDRSRPWASR